MPDSVEGPVPAGFPANRNPVFVAGTDGTSVRGLLTDGTGKLLSSASFTQPTSSTAVEHKVEVLSTSTEIAPANSSRKTLEIQNNGKEPCWISFTGAAVEGKGFKLEPGASWSTGAVTWTGKVFAICKTTKEAITTAIEME